MRSFFDVLNNTGFRYFLTVIGLVIAFLIGIVQYVENSKREHKKPFLATQLELCLSASQSAARIAHPISKDDFKVAQTRFLELYWGGLAMVEDQCVTNKMIDYKKEMGELKFEDERKKDLSRAALMIAFACRNLVSKSWTDVGALDWSKGEDLDGTPANYPEIIENCVK